MKNQSIILTIILGIISLTSCNNNKKEVTPTNNNTIIEQPIVWKTPTTYLNNGNYIYYSQIEYVKNCKINKTGTFESKVFSKTLMSDTVYIYTYTNTIKPPVSTNSTQKYIIDSKLIKSETTVIQNIQVAREGQSLIKYKDVIYQNTDLTGYIII